ncbi:hypothetical protein H311_03739, partial [Anncaliia algerae PRA109]
VQIDEAMLNFMFKSHRGRSLCIKLMRCASLKLSKKKRAYAQTIPNKKTETLIPIISAQVCRLLLYELICTRIIHPSIRMAFHSL